MALTIKDFENDFDFVCWKDKPVYRFTLSKTKYAKGSIFKSNEFIALVNLKDGKIIISIDMVGEWKDSELNLENYTKI